MRTVVCMVFVIGTLTAAPNICYVSNDALVPPEVVPGSTVPGCSMGANHRALLAQGSIASLIGDGFPPSANLNDVSVRLVVGSATMDATVLAIERQRIRALIPSGIPMGDGTLLASYNGTSNPYPIRLVERSFHIYSRAPQALAHNVSQQAEWSANSFSNPARPGRYVVLWGTGMGVKGGEELEVFFGLVPARRILYAGPSACCPGADQLVIETPGGIEGCTVPVIARFPGDADDYGYPSVAIASRSGPCLDPHGMNLAALRLVETNGSARIGQVSLGGVGWWVNDGVFASFSRFSSRYVMPPGTCGNLRWAAPSHQESAYWDAGDHLTFSAPNEDRAVPHHEDYNAQLLGSVYVSSFKTRNLPAGSYTIHNGSGGAHVGPFQVSFPITHSSLQWTNRETLAPVRGEDLRLEWRTSGWESGFVAISVSALTFQNAPNGHSLGGFTCLEAASSEGFTVPAWVLWPRAGAAEVLDVQLRHFTRQEFAAQGLDFGEFTYTRQAETVRKSISSSQN